MNDPRTSPRSSFRWNDLPAEMKNMICGYSLDSEGPLVVRLHEGPDGSSRLYSTSHDKPATFNPNMVLLNQETHKETAKLLCRGKDFRFASQMAYVEFMLRLEHSPFAGYIEHITLPGWVKPCADQDLTYKILASSVKSLKTITLDYCWGMTSDFSMSDPDRTALAFVLAGVEHVLMAFGKTNAERRAGIDRTVRLCYELKDNHKAKRRRPTNLTVEQRQGVVEKKFKEALKKLFW